MAYGQNPAGYPPAQGMVAGGAYAPAKSNTLLKVVVGLLIVLFVGGALALAGLYYAAKKIKAKAEEATAKVMRENPSAAEGLGGLLGGVASGVAGAAAAGDQSADGVKGDPCRFLSKEEVSQAVGVTIIRADAQDEGCSYIAKGDPADATAKHTSALMGEMGIDAKSQKQAEKIAGAFFAQQEAGDKDLSAEAAKGEIAVLGLSFTSGNAAMEMKMNRGAFGYVRGGPTFGQGDAKAEKKDTGDLTGIGDDALVAAGSMILVRKGNVVAHFIFAGCPCSTSAITPLAKLVANRL